MSLSLKQAADRLGLTRPKLIKRMQEADLIGEDNLPKHPVRDRLYLYKKESSWHHPVCGLQYSWTTKVKAAGIPWLAEKLGIERPMPVAEPDRRDVA